MKRGKEDRAPKPTKPPRRQVKQRRQERASEERVLQVKQSPEQGKPGWVKKASSHMDHGEKDEQNSGKNDESSRVLNPGSPGGPNRNSTFQQLNDHSHSRGVVSGLIGSTSR